MNEQVQSIADTLGETEPGPIKQIGRVLQILGPERVQALVEETLQVEASGGMMTNDGKRRRTIGGVFFKQVRDKTTREERHTIFPHLKGKKKKPKDKQPKSQAEPPTLEELQQAINEVIKQRGAASTVKMTLIGRPGQVIEKGDVVLLSMQSVKAPSLPKGLPKPPTDPTTYLIFIAMKQWRKVKDSINKNVDDKLIIEGYPVFLRRLTAV